MNVEKLSIFRSRTFGTLCGIAFGVFSTFGERLVWTDPNQAGVVKSFIIYATGPLPSATMRQITVSTNEVDLSSFLQNAPSGIYSAYGFSVGTNGLRSARSESILVPWTSPRDPVAGGDGPCSKVAQRHESAGVVVQMFHDKAHAYGATLYKATSSGQSCRIEVNLRKHNQPTGEITVYVWNNIRNHPGTIMASSTTTIDAGKVNDGWYEASLNFTHKAGDTYWIGLGKPSVDSANNLLWLGGGLGARYYSADGKAWVYSSSEAMNLRIYDE